MVPTTTSLIGFSGVTIWPLGQLRLLVTIGDVDHSIKAWMNFMIVRSLSPYNGIIGRPGIREIQVVLSTAHIMLKFPVDGGVVTIPPHPDFPDQEVAIGGTLSAKGRTNLCSLLKKHLDIFAWHPSDMTGVPRSVEEHQLNIREGYSPVRQKKRGQAPDHAKVIQAEVQKLVEAGIMREVVYHEWLSNLVMDCYPLPEIDWKVESLCGYPFQCFLDAYKGYHQIQMAESDEEKTAFHTSQEVYCHTKMPFGLKNVGATYQRLVDKAFDSQVGQNIELNPKKCTFGAVKGMFLGYMISPDGIKPCPDKTEETPEAEQAFKQLKQHLSELPLLVAPKPKEELIVYMSASYGAVSAVSMTERGTVQTPVYFVSRTLQGPELNYTPMEKLVLSLVFSAKRLRRTYPGGLPYREVGRKSARHISYGNSVGVVDTIHRWIVMCRWNRRWLNTDKPGRNRVHLRAKFTASNNEAEYEALIVGLRIAAQMGVRNVQVSVDSKLVANQILGTYVAKKKNMVKYLEKAKSLISGFSNFSVLIEILKEKSIQKKEVEAIVEEEGPT
ncbi:reverse transcriptase domain-containing protein [Tanacetum coccineum]